MSKTKADHVSSEVSRVQNDPECVVAGQSAIEPVASLRKALAFQSANGSNYRTITPYRPMIMTCITHPKKDKGTLRIKGVFSGKKDYCLNDHMTCAFVELAELSRGEGKVLIHVICTLNDETNQWLRDVDERAQGRTMIQSITRSLEQAGWHTDSIVVIEECPDSTCDKLTQGELNRLHIHMLTFGDEDDCKRLRSILKPFSKQTMIKTSWTEKHLHNANDEIQEEQFDEMPVGQVDPGSNHWLNTYKTMDDQGRCWVHVEHPVCLRGADYLSKGLNDPIGRGRNFTLIGLTGARQRRLELYRAGLQYRSKPSETTGPISEYVHEGVPG